jgi:catechol 2,3-dioxygenase-like lactoylglutathione lyase family enzyme
MLGSEKIVAFVGTRDPQRAKAFYQNTLGLKLLNQDQFALVFDANGIMLRVTTVQEVVTAPYTVLGWQVADLRSTTGKLRDAGVELERYPFMKQDDLGIWIAPGGGQVAWFKDPDGNLLSVVQL